MNIILHFTWENIVEIVILAILLIFACAAIILKLVYILKMKAKHFMKKDKEDSNDIRKDSK